MIRRMREIGVVGIIALLALFALIPVAGAAPRSAETKNVSIKDFEFDPKTVSVAVGDTVMWKNAGAAPHTATANDGTFNSGTVNVGGEFSFTFTKAGTFSYACKFHDIMQGTIEVKDAAAPVAAPAAQTPTGTVDAADQAVANSSITVANVTAGQDGWIVAHLDEGGAPGKVLGQTAVKKGDNKNVAIKLSESVPAGGKLWPMLHIDAGTVGTYEFPGADAPVIGTDGKPVMKQISVSAAAPVAQAPTDSVDVSDQAVANSSITVANVKANQDGWIVAHLDEGGAPGKVLGQTAIKKGDNRNVAIKLSESVPAGGKLWPMLHIDAGTVGTYEFPGADAPVIGADGKPVMKQISVTAAGAPPAQLPTTGGAESTAVLLLGALALLALGASLVARQRRA